MIDCSFYLPAESYDDGVDESQAVTKLANLTNYETTLKKYTKSSSNQFR